MFTQLNTLLHLQSSAFDDPINVLVLDEFNADGSFLIHHFLSTYLRRPSQMRSCLLSFAHLFEHYALIGKRLGVNLMDNPDLIFIDAVTRLTTEIVLAGNGEQSALYTSDGVNSTIETDINALMLNNDSNDYDNGSQFGRTAIHRLSLPLPFAIDYYHTTSSSQRLPHTPSLSGLIGLVQDFINDTVQLLGKQPCLLIDDLGMLLNVGVEPKELHHFLSYLQRTLSKVGGHLVVLMHADGYRERDDVTVVIDELIYGSHYIIRSQAFVSGQSAELDGELSLDRGPLNMDPEFNRQTLHYKLTEQSELKLYGKGLSSAVM